LLLVIINFVTGCALLSQIFPPPNTTHTTITVGEFDPDKVVSTPEIPIPHVKDEVIIRFKDPATAGKKLNTILPLFNGKVVGSIPDSGDYQIQFNSISSVSEVINQLEDDSDIELVIPNIVLENKASQTSSSSLRHPSCNNNWGLEKIQVQKAWEITKGVEVVKVAVIDSGIDQNHPGFSNLTTLSITSDTKDKVGHGTHVAGIVGSTEMGVAPQISILSVKIWDKEGPLFAVRAGIQRAIQLGAKIINASIGAPKDFWASGDESIPEKFFSWASKWYQRMQLWLGPTISESVKKNILIVVAAGNRNMDVVYQPLASIPEVFAVAAVDKNDRKAFYSEYGAQIAVAAPGGDAYRDQNQSFDSGDICSTAPSYDIPGWAKYYAYNAGTSMAAPFVAGVAALIWSLDYQTNKKFILSVDEVKNIIKETADPLQDTGMGAGRINAYKALLKTQERLGIKKAGKVTVCNQGADYTSIQAAIDAVEPGSTIEVCGGTYEENLTISKSLKLQGQSRSSVLIKRRDEKSNTINVKSDSKIQVTIEKLTVVGPSKTDKNSGVVIDGDVNVLIQDVEISQCVGLGIGNGAQATLKNLRILDTFGGLVIFSAQVNIQDSQFSNNEISGLFAGDSAIITIQGSEFSNNYYHGLYVMDSSQVTIQDSKFFSNKGHGIDVFSDESVQITIQDSEIFNNEYSGVSIYGSGAQVQIIKNKIHGNKFYGIDVYRANNILKCRENLVTNNGTDYNKEAAERCK
jgi:thermitase